MKPTKKQIKEALEIIPRCKTCHYFDMTFKPKLTFINRLSLIKNKHLNLTDNEQMSIVEDWRNWEQVESGNGFCRWHDIETQIPNHMSCLDHRKKTAK